MHRGLAFKLVPDRTPTILIHQGFVSSPVFLIWCFFVSLHICKMMQLGVIVHDFQFSTQLLQWKMSVPQMHL